MTRKLLAENLYLLGLALLVAAMPLSVFMMSVSQFVLVASWVISGNVWGKIKTAFTNPAVAVLAMVYFMHLVGGFYSRDADYFYNDIRIKLPLLGFPVLIYTSPKLSEKWFEKIMIIFITALSASTFISMGVLYDIFPHKNPIDDIRNISVFVSHIRLSLFICIAIFASAYFLWKYRDAHFLKKILLILLIAWFMVFLFILEALTGVIILIITSVVIALYIAFRQKNLLIKTTACVIICTMTFASVWYVRDESKKVYSTHTPEINELEKTTVNGNRYDYHFISNDQENGNFTWIYVCEKELSPAWNHRSKLNYSGKDLKGNELKYTLIRFLTSKGLRKDSAGIYSLNENEIHSIENGIANVDYQKMGNLQVRIRKTIMEYYAYKNGANPTGNSVLQRLEYWKAGWNILKQHAWTGVGTGDVQQAFDKEYDRVNSPLSKEYRHRAHNQFLTFAVTFGIFGLIYFLFSLFYPEIKLKMNTDYFYVTFFLIVFLSMLTEDTLETQAGVTFFAFFNSFLLFAREKSSHK